MRTVSGIVMKSDGYLYVHRVMVDEKFWPMFGKGSDWMPVHRYVVAKHFGRCLTSEESVHHVDFDKLNNVIENLEVMSWEEHRRIHAETKGSVEIVVEKRQKTVMPNTQIAKVLGVSRNTISSWLKTGRLKDATLDAVLEFVREDERRSVWKEIEELSRFRANGRRRDDEEEVR